MIISATLTNGENCQFDSVQFDSVQFDSRWGASNRERAKQKAAIAAAKRWAAGRGGEYGLSVAILDGHGEGYAKSIGEFYYSGKCVRGVAV
jgi:hypothetical protein